MRFLRQLIGLDEFYVKQISGGKVLGDILDVLNETMPRDNLLSSACLEFFEFIKKENVKDLIKYVVEHHRDKLQKLAYMELFRYIILRYDQTRGFTINLDYFLESDEVGSNSNRGRINPRTGGLMEHITMDHAEEEYWNTSDDEDEPHGQTGNGELASANGASPGTKLVDYASDEELDEAIGGADAVVAENDENAVDGVSKQDDGAVVGPPERLSEKRRREENEEEDLSKLVQHKRRNSTSASANPSTTSGFLRKRSQSSANVKDAGSAGRKIAISLSPSIKAGNGQIGGRSDDEA